MRPAAIIYAAQGAGDDHVMRVINYAIAANVAVAIRTGGHHYAGSSSTAGANVQLDLSGTYPEFDTATADLAAAAGSAPACPGLDADPANGIVKVGVSLTLAQFNAALGARDLFVPHGQCSNVHVGGHAQTGGWGQLARSHGLFADHIVGFRIIALDAAAGHTAPCVRIVRRGSDDSTDAAFFFGCMGGSPGNFGVITHVSRGALAMGSTFTALPDTPPASRPDSG